MPASRFFAMRRALLQLRNTELARACLISRASAVSNDGFKELTDFFQNLEMPFKRPKDVVLPVVEPQEKVEPLRGEAARARMFAAFGRDHRVIGNNVRRSGGKSGG